MAFTHRGKAFVGVLLAIGALAGAGYALRWRLSRATQPAPGGGTTQGITTAPPSNAGVTNRGDVTIDPRRQQLMNVRTVAVTRASVAQSITAVGQVRYDETRLADVNLKLDGYIRELFVDSTGQPIRSGQPLFTIYSPDLLATETEYLLALKTRDQLQQSQMSDARIHADQIVAAARERLALWDVPPADIETLEQKREPVAAVTFRSPVGGFVIEKTAVRGMHVMPGQTLYKVADLSVVWVEANVSEQDLAQIRVGAQATVMMEAYPGERFTGRVAYVYPTVDEATRTVKVRVTLANSGGRLKPGLYAKVELHGAGGSGLVVPSDAVLDSGREQLVFVAQGDGHFEPRRVKIGRRLQGGIQILDGLKEGEQVASGATFFLDSESQLRASLQAFEAAVPDRPVSVPAEQVSITVRTQPDPLRTGGDNTFEITLKDASGKPVDDAEVSLQFFMAAMPTMNMPAMRNQVKVPAVGGGVYRGPGEVMMAGRWDVTVVVTRNGQRVGSRQLAMVAR